MEIFFWSESKERQYYMLKLLIERFYQHNKITKLNEKFIVPLSWITAHIKLLSPHILLWDSITFRSNVSTLSHQMNERTKNELKHEVSKLLYKRERAERIQLFCYHFCDRTFKGQAGNNTTILIIEKLRYADTQLVHRF